MQRSSIALLAWVYELHEYFCFYANQASKAIGDRRSRELCAIFGRQIHCGITLTFWISNLHIPASSHADRLSTHVTKQRTAHSEHRTSSFRRSARPPKRNILKGGIARLSRLLLCLRYPQSYLLAIGGSDESAFFLRRRQAGRNVPEGNRIGADPERRTPFFRDGFRETCDTSLG